MNPASQCKQQKFQILNTTNHFLRPMIQVEKPKFNQDLHTAEENPAKKSTVDLIHKE